MNIRWAQLGIAFVTIAGVVSTNLDLLPLNPNQKNLVTLLCLVILAFNHSIVGVSNAAK